MTQGSKQGAVGQGPVRTTGNEAVKDSLLRTMKTKWFLGMLALLIMMAILAIVAATVEDVSSSILIMILNIVLNVAMSAIGWIFIIRSWKTMKVLQFMNFRKVQRFVLPSMVIIMIAFLGMPMFLVWSGYPIHYFLFILVLMFTLYFLGLMAMRKRYTGSIADWYNNIVVILGSEVQTLNDGFTERPYSMNILGGMEQKDILPRVGKYAQSMLDNVLIAGLEKRPDMVVMYIPSPTMITMMANPNSSRMAPPINEALKHSSKIIVYADGTLSVNVSREDYERIGVPITYHELCQKMLTVFGASMKAYFKGDELKAVELLGGRGHIERRRRIIRTNDHRALRLGIVVTVAILLMLVGPIHQGWTVLDKTASNSDGGYARGEMKFDIHPRELSFMIGSDLARPGDEFQVEFQLNRTIPGLRVEISDGMGHQRTIKEMTNVQVGVFTFKVPDDFNSAFIDLVFDCYGGIHVVAATLQVKVTHLNSYSMWNMTLGMIIIGTMIMAEFIIYKKNSLEAELAEKPKPA